MEANQAGTAALGAVADILHHLLGADTARHGGDGPAYGEPVAHAHQLLDWETRTRLQGVADRVDGLLMSLRQPEPAGIEAAARKYHFHVWHHVDSTEMYQCDCGQVGRRGPVEGSIEYENGDIATTGFAGLAAKVRRS